MTADPTPAQIHAFLADCRLRRRGWAGFQAGTRRSALHILTTREPLMPRYEVRTIDADPNPNPVTWEIDFHRPPPEPVHYLYDTEKDRPVPLSSTHDRAAADRACAERNARA